MRTRLILIFALSMLTLSVNSQEEPTPLQCHTEWIGSCQEGINNDIQQAQYNLREADYGCLTESTDWIGEQWGGFLQNVIEMDMQGFVETLREQADVFEEIQQANDCIRGATDEYNLELDNAAWWYDVCMDANPCPPIVN